MPKDRRLCDASFRLIFSTSAVVAVGGRVGVAVGAEEGWGASRGVVRSRIWRVRKLDLWVASAVVGSDEGGIEA